MARRIGRRLTFARAKIRIVGTPHWFWDDHPSKQAVLRYIREFNQRRGKPLFAFGGVIHYIRKPSMGIYINVPDKQEWLEEHGRYLGQDYECVPHYLEIPPDERIVCLVENPMFNAAAVVFDAVEYRRIVENPDSRLKRWYLVPFEVLKTVVTLP